MLRNGSIAIGVVGLIGIGLSLSERSVSGVTVGVFLLILGAALYRMRVSTHWTGSLEITKPALVGATMGGLFVILALVYVLINAADATAVVGAVIGMLVITVIVTYVVTRFITQTRGTKQS